MPELTFGLFEAFFLHPLMMLLYGLLTNFGRKVLSSTSYKTVSTPCITDYWKTHPVQSGLALIGALVGYALFVPGVEELSKYSHESQLWNMARMTAFGLGFMADSVADAIGEKTLRSLPTLRKPDVPTDQQPKE